MSSPPNSNGIRDAEYEGDHDPHFDPIITLPEIVVNTFEEDETILIKERAKLFRHDNEENEWKERGTGDAKLLLNEDTNMVRVLMRREKTYKICANHCVTKDMELKPSCGSDRAWVWTTPADISDGEPSSEVLAIKFQNSAAAQRWKDAFEKAKDIIQFNISHLSDPETNSTSEESDEEITKKVEDLIIENKGDSVDKTEKDAEG